MRDGPRFLPARIALAFFAFGSLGFGWGYEDRLDNPIARGLSLAQLLHRNLLVDFVSRDDPFTWRLDEEVYTNQQVVGVLMEEFAVGSSQRIAARHERQRRLSILRQSPLSRPQRRPDGQEVTQHPVQGCVRVAIEDYPDLAERYAVTAVPAFLVMTEEGRVVARHTGFLDADRMLRFLRRAAEEAEGLSGAPSPSSTSDAFVSSASPPTSATRREGPGEVLTPGSARTGRIDREHRRATYRLDAAERPVQVFLSTLTPRVDLDLEAVDARSGEVLARSASTGGEESLFWEAPGEVEIAVYLYGDEIPAEGASFTVSVEPAPEGPDASSVEVAPLPWDKEVWGRIGEGAWERYYAFDVEEGASYRLELAAADTSVDLDLELFDASGAVLDRSAGVGGREEIVRTAESSGVRQVRVFAYTPARASNFVLRLVTLGRSDVRAVDGRAIHFDVSRDAPLLELGKARNDVLAATGEGALYRFEASASGMYVFLLNADPSVGDLDLAVLDAEGNVLASSQGAAASEALLLELTAGTSVWVRVYAYGVEGEAPYRIWVRAE